LRGRTARTERGRELAKMRTLHPLRKTGPSTAGAFHAPRRCR